MKRIFIRRPANARARSSASSVRAALGSRWQALFTDAAALSSSASLLFEDSSPQQLCRKISTSIGQLLAHFCTPVPTNQVPPGSGRSGLIPSYDKHTWRLASVKNKVCAWKQLREKKQLSEKTLYHWTFRRLKRGGEEKLVLVAKRYLFTRYCNGDGCKAATYSILWFVLGIVICEGPLIMRIEATIDVSIRRCTTPSLPP